MKSIPLKLAVAGIALISAVSIIQAQDTTSADKTFVADAAQGSLAEVNFAKLALQKSKDKNVREFATKMIKDHEKLIAEMKPFAAKLHVKEPTGPSLMMKAKYEELKLQSGISFDRAYVEAMVKDHHDDLKDFIDEKNKTSDSELKSAVTKAEAVIREHTEMINGIAHMGGISTPDVPQGV